jgi:hypothetical protein
MKTYQKLKWELDQKKPKLYATILKYLSDESLEAIQKTKDWTDIKEKVDPERLWLAIEEKHRVHSTSKVAAIVKLEARNQLQNMRQGAFESIISYKQRYNNALKAYHDQGNPTKDGADQAMDFFHGLDNGRYADFKIQYLNGAMQVPMQQRQTLWRRKRAVRRVGLRRLRIKWSRAREQSKELIPTEKRRNEQRS